MSWSPTRLRKRCHRHRMLFLRETTVGENDRAGNLMNRKKDLLHLSLPPRHSSHLALRSVVRIPIDGGEKDRP